MVSLVKSTVRRHEATKRGGKRAGAGRKPELSRQLTQARELAKELHTKLQLGLSKLGAEYVNLMDLAIQKAKGGFDGGKPDARMLALLLELLPRLAGRSQDAAESPIDAILKDLRVRTISLTQNNYGTRPVVADVSGGDQDSRDRAVSGVAFRVLPPE